MKNSIINVFDKTSNENLKATQLQKDKYFFIFDPAIDLTEYTPVASYRTDDSLLDVYEIDNKLLIDVWQNDGSSVGTPNSIIVKQSDFDELKKILNFNDLIDLIEFKISKDDTLLILDPSIENDFWTDIDDVPLFHFNNGTPLFAESYPNFNV